MRLKFLLLIAAIALPASAYADQATDSAREHYQRATSLYDVGRFAEAANEYEAAFQLKNDPALLFNLGQAYRYAGEYSKAIFAYRGYLRRVPAAENRAEVEGYIAKAQQAMRQQPETPSANSKTATPEPKTAAPPTPSTSEQLTATSPPPAASKTPAYKKWWVWTIVGVAVAGAGVGLGLGLTTHSTTSTPVFPSVGGQQ